MKGSFLDKNDEKIAIKIYKKITGKKQVVTFLDSTLMSKILFDLEREKIEKSSLEDLKKWLEKNEVSNGKKE